MATLFEILQKQTKRGHWLQRWIFRRIPYWYKLCPAGCVHKPKDEYCFCRLHKKSKKWNGGAYVFKTRKEKGCDHRVKD